MVAIVKKTLGLIEKAFDISTDEHNPNEALIILMENMFKIIETHQGFLRMIIPLSMQIREFEFINKMIFSKYDESVKKMSILLEKMEYKNPEDEARIIIAGLDGIMYQYLVLGDNLPYEKIKNGLINKYKI